MTPEQHRSGRSLAARCPDIEIEAILVELLLAGQREEAQQIFRQGEDIRALDGHVAVVDGVADAGPRLGPEGRPEAQIAERRLGIGNALEDFDTAVADAADAPGVGLDDDFLCHEPSLARTGGPALRLHRLNFAGLPRHQPPQATCREMLINLPSGAGWP